MTEDWSSETEYPRKGRWDRRNNKDFVWFVSGRTEDRRNSEESTLTTRGSPTTPNIETRL